MRIPLDYYRILGLPMQATAEQLQQAHRDRTLQLPRREFSEVAIEARKQLIDEAYTVLSDPAHRQEYDASAGAKFYELLEVGISSEGTGTVIPLDRGSTDLDDVDPYAASIEIADAQFVGALLILQELGEYELVQKLARPYLSGGNPAVRQGRFGDPALVSADIVLTAALASLELGREQWQQGQYENAAVSLQMGQDMLLQEGLFPNLRGEMQSDLYKLRPYRILELVALPESQVEARRHGIQLLEDMLQDRGGIDGTGDDQSGLGVDDFLRFIQQLRGYLTATEQQTLFEAESRRPSAVAIYLAVYALLAKGFAERQPALIRRAKGMLQRLGTRQDVHLEQAVCSLLLGQTDEASQALDLSQEMESLEFIREHSQDSPDLLPGLCLYSERWLQNEVFPYFRNLSRKPTSLKEYFADEEVQAYLEELPNEPEPFAPRPPSRPTPTYRPSSFESRPLSEARLQPSDRLQADFTPSPAPVATIEPEAGMEPGGNDRNGNQAAVSSNETQLRTSVRERRLDASNGSGGTPPRRSPGGRNVRLDRLLFLAALGVLGVLLLGFLFSRVFKRDPAPVANTPQVQPITPTLDQIVGQQSLSVAATTPLDETNAITVVEAWLSAKAAAMGRDHNVNALENILTDPALSSWQERAEEAKASNSYWLYEHSDVKVNSVESLPGAETEESADATPTEAENETAPDNATESTSDDATATGSTGDDATTGQTVPQTAIIDASVTEKGEFYSNGQLDRSSSYESTLEVQYSLVQDNGEWRIQSWEVLE